MDQRISYLHYKCRDLEEGIALREANQGLEDALITQLKADAERYYKEREDACYSEFRRRSSELLDRDSASISQTDREYLFAPVAQYELEVTARHQ